jgi:hypothetical protein
VIAAANNCEMVPGSERAVARSMTARPRPPSASLPVRPGRLHGRYASDAGCVSIISCSARPSRRVRGRPKRAWKAGAITRPFGSSTPDQIYERRALYMVCRTRRRNLVERALPGRLVEAPAHQLRTVPEAVAGDVIEPHLDHCSGGSGSHSPLRSALHRLGPPGALPVNPAGSRSSSRLRVSAGRSALVIVEVKRTWSSLPSAS